MSSLFLIGISELGDKTFFITAILAMRYSRRWVLSGAVLALAAMTGLSVGLGQLAALLPAALLQLAEVGLFLGFGGKLLYEGSRMSAQASNDEVKAAQAAVGAAPGLGPSIWAILSQAFTLIFLAEWGDRTQFATISLATTHSPLGIAMGATLGHTMCALIAVCCGRLLAARLSERALTLSGGALFLVFGVWALVR